MPPFTFVVPSWEAVLRQLLLAPVIEEVLFRLGLQEPLSRSRLARVRRHAVALTVIAFGAAHALALIVAGHAGPMSAMPAMSAVPAMPMLPLLLALATAIPAWWIGRDYRRHRSLRRCMTWHAAFNACWLLLAAPAVPSLLSTL